MAFSLLVDDTVAGYGKGRVQFIAVDAGTGEDGWVHRVVYQLKSLM